MDKNGIWKVALYTWMKGQQSKFEYVLTDPNGNWAGERKMTTLHEGTDSIELYIESDHGRAQEHQMPFAVKAWFNYPTDIEKAQVEMEIQKSVANCDKMQGVPCNPKVVTETKSENVPFFVDSCFQYCRKDHPEDQRITPGDLGCEDLNDVNWEQKDGGWVREFNCDWKGF
jgi:hypothetical protein